MLLQPTPFEPFRFEGRLFYVKRDDLSHLFLSGNKFRKLHTLIQTPPEQIETVISYGGVQSNAMLAIASLCHHKGWGFDYTAKSVPAHLKNDPKGNYRHALSLGMRLNEVTPAAYDAAVAALLQSGSARKKCVVVAQGGAVAAAEEGIGILAGEIRAWMEEMRIDKLTVATPSGTGTTAAFLAKALPECTVVTTPAVGESGYLLEQIGKLLPPPPNLRVVTTEKRYRFGKPDPSLLQIHQKLSDAGIVFDLLYAPVMWTALMENIKTTEGEVLYVHSGGVSGNETMLARYERMNSDK